MAPEKASVVTSSEVVSGLPTMEPETSLDDALAVHGALGLAVGVRIGPFCKLQNVLYLEL